LLWKHVFRRTVVYSWQVRERSKDGMVISLLLGYRKMKKAFQIYAITRNKQMKQKRYFSFRAMEKQDM
jgi:hypothetical protein